MSVISAYFKKNYIYVPLSNKAKQRKLYNYKNLERWLNDNRLETDHSFAMKIWMLINIEIFMQKYFD